MRKKQQTESRPAGTSARSAPRDIRWDKLDNTAHLFPVIAGEQMSNVYRISVTLTEPVDPELLQRALDNLYSNLTKYADPETAVCICYERKDAHRQLSISNGIRMGQSSSESTGIGLNTCRRILQHHGGSFASGEADGMFTVTMTLPLQL